MMNLIETIYEEQGFVAVSDFVEALSDEQEESLLNEISI